MNPESIAYLSEDAELFPDGTLHDVTLARDTEIQGLPCASGKNVVFFPDGRLKIAFLSRPATVTGIPCDAGILYLHENGQAANTRLATAHPFDRRLLPAQTRVTLDEDGRVLEFSRTLLTDESLSGLPCASAFRVWLYPTGRPSRLVLAADAHVDGIHYPAGSQLSLDPLGRVTDCIAVDLNSAHKYKQQIFGTIELPYD